MHEGGGQPRVPRGHLPTNPARPRPGPNHPAEQVPNHFIQHCGCTIKSLIFTSTLKSLEDVFFCFKGATGGGVPLRRALIGQLARDLNFGSCT